MTIVLHREDLLDRCKSQPITAIGLDSFPRVKLSLELKAVADKVIFQDDDGTELILKAKIFNR